MTERVVIWGRPFDLDIVFDCFEDEEILDSQREALSEFLDALSTGDFLNLHIVDQAKPAVEKYCIDHSEGELKGSKLDNIFRYVIPTGLYVVRAEKDHEVALMCNFRFDLEHGMAIVFRNLKLSEIGAQDIVL